MSKLLDEVVSELSRLPGIGSKTALRLARKKARPFSGEAAVRRESEVWIGPAQRANAMPCMGKII